MVSSVTVRSSDTMEMSELLVNVRPPTASSAEESLASEGDDPAWQQVAATIMSNALQRFMLVSFRSPVMSPGYQLMRSSENFSAALNLSTTSPTNKHGPLGRAGQNT